MSTKPSQSSRRIATAAVAIAVTALLHGGWLADVNGPPHAPVTLSAA